jgi:hypothetical protein
MESMVDPQTKHEIFSFTISNKFDFGYEWQVIMTCSYLGDTGQGVRPDITQWIDATTGQPTH